VTRQLSEDIVHREMHSSRAVPSIAVALAIACGGIYVLLEAALKAVGQDPWLLQAQDAAAWIGGLPAGAGRVLLGTIGALLLALGLACLLAGVLPGKRARFHLPDTRAAVVVDADVLASALARRARAAAGVAPEQVLATVGRRDVHVEVRPTSGIPVDAAEVQRAVEEELDRSGVRPRIRVGVSIAPRGVVGQ
jgi:hypothetical protein